MEVKKEPTNPAPEGTVKIKEEPLYYLPPTAIKKEPDEIRDLFLKNPVDYDQKVDVPDLYVNINEHSNIKKEVKDEIVPETELLSTDCDLPTIKSEDFIEQPCTSKQLAKVLKKPTKSANKKKKRKYPCPVCQKNNVSSKSRWVHFKGHFGKCSISCIFCGTFSNTTFDFLRHYFEHFVKKRKHNYKNLFQCGICSKSFKEISDLTQHISDHIRLTKFTCNVCYESFETKLAILYHVVSLHKKDISKFEV